MTTLFFVLNNCGKPRGKARQWAGYRHIALMKGDPSQTMIRNTKRATIIEACTVYVGSTMKSSGYRKLNEYTIKAMLHNKLITGDNQ